MVDSNEEEYSPAMREQMLEAICKYGRDNGIKPEFYHMIMNDALGISSEKKKFHSGDPRHWIKGHVPKKEKLDMYARFIKKVNPDFEFSNSRRNTYISIAQLLSRFSAGEKALSEAKLKILAKSLNRKFFVSDSYQGVTLWDDVALSTLLTFRMIAETPFLLAYKFTYKQKPNEAEVKFKSIVSRLNQDGDNVTQNEDLQNLESNLDTIIEVNGFSITKVQKGIVSPLANGIGYHGILQTNNYMPNHISLTSEDNGKLTNGFIYRGIGEIGSEFAVMRFIPCGPFSKLDKIISDMGEPVL